jgi:FkbM family methyltransferase
MLIFDIGANVGAFAIANQDGNKIISIEAVPDTYRTLYNNTNSYNNIISLNYAVSATPFSATFYSCPACNVLATLNKDWLSSDISRFGHMKNTIVPIKVPTITLDALISQYGIPDILKVDVEGAEEEVVGTLTSKVPVLCFEWAAEWRGSMYRTLDYVDTLGFKKFYVQEGDNYTFRPTEYNMGINHAKQYLAKSKDKENWGMIWCI